MAKENNSKEFRFSSVDLIVFAWEKRIPLIIITAVAAIASIIISLTMTNLFKSQVVLFPAPNTSVSKYLLSDQYAGPYRLAGFWGRRTDRTNAADSCSRIRSRTGSFKNMI